MDAAAILRRYDAEIRADPPPEVGVQRSWVDGVLRTTGAYNHIGWWTFGAAEAAAVVAREAAFFAGGELQWKVFDHDGPPNLPATLAAAGFEAAEPETFVVLDMDETSLSQQAPLGIEVREVSDRAGVLDLMAASNAAFGRDDPRRTEALVARLGDPTQRLYVAYADGVPVSSGRLELAPGKAFAGLYGGGTRPEYQGRGIYRALVATRGAEARRQGCRFLTVDARETSRPILERLGFQALTKVRDWELPDRR
jgi:GNAT superfamily N-acetyltransferase